jgi:hypothetical protein
MIKAILTVQLMLLATLQLSAADISNKGILGRPNQVNPDAAKLLQARLKATGISQKPEDSPNLQRSE